MEFVLVNLVHGVSESFEENNAFYIFRIIFVTQF